MPQKNRPKNYHHDRHRKLAIMNEVIKIDKDMILKCLAFADHKPLMTRIVAVNFQKQKTDRPSRRIVAWLSASAANNWESYSAMLDKMKFPYILTVGNLYEICQPSEERLDEWEKELKRYKKTLRPLVRKEFDRMIKNGE